MIDDMAESEEAAELRLNLEKRLVAPQQRAFEAFVDAEQPRRWWGRLDSPSRTSCPMQSRERSTGSPCSRRMEMDGHARAARPVARRAVAPIDACRMKELGRFVRLVVQAAIDHGEGRVAGDGAGFLLALR